MQNFGREKAGKNGMQAQNINVEHSNLQFEVQFDGCLPLKFAVCTVCPKCT